MREETLADPESVARRAAGIIAEAAREAVDERMAPAGHADRKLTHLRTSLFSHLPEPPRGLHAMPVEELDLDLATSRYAETLRSVCGTPAVLARNLYLVQQISLAGVAHQNGTLRFGRDPVRSVLDVNCKTHDVDNLYVVDTSSSRAARRSTRRSPSWRTHFASVIT